jgi:hypothetical protein
MSVDSTPNTQAFFFTADQPRKVRDIVWPLTEGNLGSQMQKVHEDDKEKYEEAKRTGQYTNARLVKHQWVDAATGLVGPGLKYPKPQYIPMSEFLDFNKKRKLADQARQLTTLKNNAIAASGFGDTARIASMVVDDNGKYVIQVVAN